MEAIMNESAKTLLVSQVEMWRNAGVIKETDASEMLTEVAKINSLMKKNEVCGMLNISRSQLERLNRMRKVKYVKIGKRGVRVSLADVRNIINGNNM
jgi:hypothetical protein